MGREADTGERNRPLVTQADWIAFNTQGVKGHSREAQISIRLGGGGVVAVAGVVDKA